MHTKAHAAVRIEKSQRFDLPTWYRLSNLTFSIEGWWGYQNLYSICIRTTARVFVCRNKKTNRVLTII